MKKIRLKKFIKVVGTTYPYLAKESDDGLLNIFIWKIYNTKFFEREIK